MGTVVGAAAAQQEGYGFDSGPLNLPVWSLLVLPVSVGKLHIEDVPVR